MDRDITDIKRTLEKLTASVDRIVTQTDELERDLRIIRTVLERMDEREEKRESRANSEASNWQDK